MRIGCYGFVEKEAGSVASANFLMLEELLKRGHNIDFYAISGFIYPKELSRFNNYAYFPVRSEFARKLWPLFIRFKTTTRIFSKISNALHYRILKGLIADNNKREKYDVFIFLGLDSEFKVKDIPVVSWPQGPPQTEWESIRRNKGQIVKLSGLTLYLVLALNYFIKIFFARLTLNRSKFIICGSQWSLGKWVEFGIRPDCVFALPYPIELSAWKISNHRINKSCKILLWAGRIVPRKRLDLLLDAFSLLLKERDDLHLRIVGSFAYGLGYKKLIDKFIPQAKLTYSSNLPREQIREIMQGVDIVVQTSENENFASSPAEALCCGIPVIVGSTNGTKDYIGDSSVVFDKYTPESVKSAMVKMLDILERNELSIKEKAREAAERNFEVKTIVDRLEQILKEAS